jgi:protein O-mannosyl-transferase
MTGTSRTIPTQPSLWNRNQKPFIWPALALFPPAFSLTAQYVVLLLLCFAFYGNTILNKYALDDTIVLVVNKHVQKGITGIPDILLRTDFENDYGNEKLRKRYYRQLSIATFAVEQSIFGGNPHVSHLINVLLFALTIAVMLALMRTFGLPNDLAFIIALLFLIHPIHTEVVANIKSRDEILCFLFCLLSLRFAIQLVDEPQVKATQKWVGLGSCYALALMAKENAITFWPAVPLTLWFFRAQPLKKAIHSIWPFIAVLVFYFILRAKLIGIDTGVDYNDVLHNRYFESNFSQKYGTIFVALGLYLKLLFVPYPLYWDYSYSQVPMFSLLNHWAIVSFLLYAGMLFWAFRSSQQKHPIAYGILFFLGLLFIVSNLVVNIGGYIAERFLYQPSFGFCFAIGSALFLAYDWLQHKYQSINPSLVIGAIGLPLILGAAYLTIARNAEWKDHMSLYAADVQKGSNSALANKAYGSIVFATADSLKDKAAQARIYRQSLPYFQRAIQIHPRYEAAHLSIGYAYLLLDSLDKAAHHWRTVQTLIPDHPVLAEYNDLIGTRYLDSANKAFARRDTLKYIQFSAKAIDFAKNKEEINLNIGLTYRDLRKFPEAITYIKRALAFNPYQAEYWFEIGKIAIRMNEFVKAKEAFEETLKINPQHIGARHFLANAPQQIKRTTP